MRQKNNVRLCQEVFRELAVEAQKLLGVNLEGSVGQESGAIDDTRTDRNILDRRIARAFATRASFARRIHLQ